MRKIAILAGVAAVLVAAPATAEDLKIALIYGKTGPRLMRSRLKMVCAWVWNTPPRTR